MPIKISVENNFLKVEGNDPERIYYERSRVSHELLPTYVQLRYDNNKLAQLDLTTLDSTNTAFTSLAAIVAFLTVAGDGDTNAGGSGGGGGGGGLTQAEAQAAFTSALQSQNQVEFQDILLEDANGVVYISTRQINEETGVVTFTNRKLDGTAHTPAQPVAIAVAKDDKTSFWANVASTGVSVGDQVIRTILPNGSVSWWNKTAGASVATAPSLSNLVPTIDQCFVQGVITTTAHTLDLPMSANTSFTDSAIIPIPTIDGKKANTLYMYRSAVPLASPLYVNDSGIIYGIQSGSTTRVPISSGAINRPNQANISNIGGFSRLNRELDGIVIRNWNLGTSTHIYRFSYQEANSDNPEIDNSFDAAYRLIAFQNNLTTTSETINAQIDIKNVTLQLYVTGATTPVTFTLEQTISLAGAGRQFPVQNITLPIGASGVGHFQIPYTSRNGQFRIVPTGTFTDYSYRLIFN
jgi:hypothetical protein